MFDAAVLDGLDTGQRQAAMHPPGPLLVLAGAGTGKTRTLIARAAWLCDQGIEPSRILLRTFTRRAADDMLARAATGGRHRVSPAARSLSFGSDSRVGGVTSPSIAAIRRP